MTQLPVAHHLRSLDLKDSWRLSRSCTYGSPPCMPGRYAALTRPVLALPPAAAAAATPLTAVAGRAASLRGACVGVLVQRDVW